MNQKELEQRLAAFCAPTLLGAKVGSLVCLSQDEFPTLSAQVQRYNAKLGRHGLRFEILREQGGRSLVFVYWTQRLQADWRGRRSCRFCARWDIRWGAR